MGHSFPSERSSFIVDADRRGVIVPVPPKPSHVTCHSTQDSHAIIMFSPLRRSPPLRRTKSATAATKAKVPNARLCAHQDCKRQEMASRNPGPAADLTRTALGTPVYVCGGATTRVRRKEVVGSDKPRIEHSRSPYLKSSVVFRKMKRLFCGVRAPSMIA
jgi:hypothetical protein